MDSSSITLLAIGVSILILLIVWRQSFSTVNDLNSQVNLTIGALIAQLEQRMNLIPDTARVAKEAVRVQYDFYMKVLEVRRGVNLQLTAEDLANAPPDTFAMLLAGSQKSISEGAMTIDTTTMNSLQSIMHDTEKDISAAKRHYWSAVAEYNTAIACFPASIVSSFHGFKPIAQPRLEQALYRGSGLDISMFPVASDPLNLASHQERHNNDQTG
jgi:hypothetical protein